MLNIAHAQVKLLRLGLVTSQIVSQLVIASGAAGVASAILPTAPALAAGTANVNAGAITGQVFNDFNGNGLQEANELGVANISVTAFDGGAPVSTTTDANGFYTVTVAGPSARVEFTGLPAQYQSSPVGVGSALTRSNTSVRFVSAPAANVNFGIFQPSTYCQNNPQLAVTCFVSGNNVSGLWQNDGTVKTQPYDASGINPSLVVTEAVARETGSTYGLAYQRSSKTIFVSAYTKRIAGFGPGTGSASSDGTGTIYMLKAGGTGAVPFVDLDDLFGAATTGNNPHTSLTPVLNDFDSGAYGAVGKVALGDIDISEDGSTLWVINLANRTLYALPIGLTPQLTPTAPTAAQVTSSPVPDPGCVNGVGRPFGIKPHNGLIYVGGVCTAEQVAPTAGITTDLQAYVFAFNPATASWSGPVLQFPLNYPRTCVDLFPSYPGACKPGVNGSLALWRPWRDVLDTTFPAGWDSGYTAYPQPMLTDIEFLDNGDMVVAFRDRFSDQIGYDDPGPQNTAPRGYNLFSLPAGDILRAGLNSSANVTGSWTLESNSASNPPGRFGPTTGQNTGEGPDNGEFYHGDFMPNSHDETVLGSLAYAPVFSSVVATVFDPLRRLTSGTSQFSNTTGEVTREFEIYPPLPPNTAGSFRKANGLGDIELLCDSAPLEIGNRVWLDSNSNGVQDTGEPVLAGVQVTLTDSLGNSTVATTDASGEYRFSSAAGSSTSNAIYNLNGAGTVSLSPFNAFTLTVDLAQAALTGLTPTLTTSDATPNGIARDSNGVLVVNPIRGASVATLTTGGPGFNNHTYDFGFRAIPPPPVFTPAIALTKYTNGEDADTPTGPLVPVGGVVTWTYLITNTGDVTLTNVTLGDDRIGLVTCPQTTLVPGQTMLCTANGTAQVGQYANVGVVTGTNQLSVTQRVTSTNPSHYFGVLPPVFTPSIALTKYTNGQDADTPTGPLVPVGGVVTWTYLITNTGNVTLTNVTLGDDRIGLVTCPQTTLVPGQTMLCTANGTAQVGQYANVGVVTGTNQLSVTQRVTSTNPSHYFGVLPPVFTPAIALTKYTNGEDADTPTGPLIPVGGVVTWTYLITNTGDVTLTNVTLGDDRIGLVTCPQTTLVPGQTMLCTANGTAQVGQYANVGVVTGTNQLSVTQRVTSTNPSHYFGVLPPVFTPSIALTKYTNGQDADLPPGPQVLAGSTVTWTYLITNTGNVTLTNIVLDDDRIGPIGCPLTTLIPGQTMTCTQTGIAVLGQYGNVGVVTGTNQLSTTQRVTSTNPSHYFAITPTTPALVIVKTSRPGNGTQVTNGNLITYTLTVTNVGSAPANNVIIDDAVPQDTTYVTGSAVPPLTRGPDPLVWNVGTLAPGQSTQVSFVVRVNQLVTTTAIVNQAFVGSDETPRRPSNQIVHPFVPTAVTLTRFDVQPNSNGQGLQIQWQTGSEINTFGFAIYRSQQADGSDSVLVTGQLVQALGAGNTYSADDPNASLNQHYYYWLVETEQNGQLIRYTPVVWQPSISGVDTVKATEQTYVAVSSPLGGGVPVQVIQPSQPSQPGVSTPQQTLNALGSNAQTVMDVAAAQVAAAQAPGAQTPASAPAQMNTSVQPAAEASNLEVVQPVAAEMPQAAPDRIGATEGVAAQPVAAQNVVQDVVVGNKEPAQAAGSNGTQARTQVQAGVAQPSVSANHTIAEASPTRPAWSMSGILAGLAVVLGLLLTSALGLFGLSFYRAQHRR